MTIVGKSPRDPESVHNRGVQLLLLITKVMSSFDNTIYNNIILT